MSEIPTYPDETIEREELAEGQAKAREPGPKWFASGLGIFCRDAGFKLATAPMSVSWQEDTRRIVDTLNAGEEVQRMRLMLGAIKAWCSRNGHAYAGKRHLWGHGRVRRVPRIGRRPEDFA